MEGSSWEFRADQPGKWRYDSVLDSAKEGLALTQTVAGVTVVPAAA